MEKIENPVIRPCDIVQVKEMGNITELMYMKHRNTKATIQKLDKDTYVVLSTGEVGEIQHQETRADNKNSVAKTLKKLRELLNTNITDVNKCRWVTLTYAENMTDTKRLYDDVKKFNKRMRYWLEKNNLPRYEYIVAMEPQGRGAWHCHFVFIFLDVAPFIPNEVLREIWGYGFVTVKKLDDVDNVGAYLTAYLGDMDLIDAQEQNTIYDGCKLKEVEFTDDLGEHKKKYYVKGARLCMYPPGFNLYRKSKGIKEPTSYLTSNKDALKKVSSAKLTFEKSIKLTSDDGEFNNTINYRYYNNKK